MVRIVTEGYDSEGHGAPQAPSLDLGTQLVLSICPAAGEGVLWRAAVPPGALDRLRDLNTLERFGAASSPAEGLTDEEWEALVEVKHVANWERANRRAKRESRRFVVANRTHIMWVLTRSGGCGLHGAEGRRRMMILAAALVLALRTQLGEQDFPYLYSPELHPAGKNGGSREVCPDPEGCGCGGHGWHLNLFVGVRLEHADVKRLWLELDEGNGYELRFKDWTLDSRVRGLPMVEKLRAAARYGSKYAAKDWSERALEGGAHRYEVSEGYRPGVVQVLVADRAEAEAVLSEMSESPVLAPTWRSDEIPDWPGPACCGYTWSPRRPGGP